jgi:putative flavoprotein involved in K+ transport
MFQFPNWSIELPGRAYTGGSPEDFSHKDDIVAFIEDYAAWIRAPVQTGRNVLRLGVGSKANIYKVVTDDGDLEARNVVIATGPYQRPKVPSCSLKFPAGVLQLHASDYRNPAGLPSGAVLVVGSGASGCQIAEELAEAGRQVYFSVGRHHRIPRRYRGRDVFWWRRELGHLDRTLSDTPDISVVRPPLVTGVRGGHDIDIRSYASKGMTLLGKISDVSEGRVALASDLEHNLGLGDQAFEKFTRAVDQFVLDSGLEVPADSGTSCSASSSRGSVEALSEIDLGTSQIRSVIWATGYSLDFHWMKLSIFDEQGMPVHRRGVTALGGIFLLGLPWLHKRKSSFLYGVGEDAEYLAEHIARASG